MLSEEETTSHRPLPICGAGCTGEAKGEQEVNYPGLAEAADRGEPPE